MLRHHAPADWMNEPHWLFRVAELMALELSTRRSLPRSGRRSPRSDVNVCHAEQ